MRTSGKNEPSSLSSKRFGFASQRDTQLRFLGSNVRMASDPSSGAKPDAIVACPLSGEQPDGEYWRWCPRCGHELHNEKCKLRCPRCHYFMSCSDFD